MKRLLSLFVLFAFVFSSLCNYPVFAQTLNLPAPTQLLNVSPNYSLPVLKGLRLDPKNPLNITFIIDAADQDKVSKEDAALLIRYFLAGLTIPQSDLWVNLSPYEQNRIVPQGLSDTDLGEDMLSQDYFLKQISASLTYPESEIGKKYWDTVNNVGARLPRPGQGNHAPTANFNKIWIMPADAQVYEHKDTALIAKASLKVMMEEDYLAMQRSVIASTAKQSQSGIATPRNGSVRNDAADAFRQHILPVIDKEVNTGKNFAQLRQVYYSLVLATWFKKKFQESFYKNYINQKKIAGIDINDKSAKDKIYALYCEAFQKGVYNYTKKERVGVNNYSSAIKITKRQYFSGGEIFVGTGAATSVTSVTERTEEATMPTQGVFVHTAPASTATDSAPNAVPDVVMAGEATQSIHLLGSQLNQFRLMIRNASIPGGAELSIEALLAILPKDAIAMRNSVEQLFEAMDEVTPEKTDINAIAEANKLNSDEQVALAVLLHPGQGVGSRKDTIDQELNEVSDLDFESLLPNANPSLSVWAYRALSKFGPRDGHGPISSIFLSAGVIGGGIAGYAVLHYSLPYLCPELSIYGSENFNNIRMTGPKIFIPFLGSAVTFASALALLVNGGYYIDDLQNELSGKLSNVLSNRLKKYILKKHILAGHLGQTQLSAFREMLSKLARPNNTDGISVEDLLETLPKNAQAMRKAVQELWEALMAQEVYAPEKIDVSAIAKTNGLYKKEAEDLFLLAAPDQDISWSFANATARAKIRRYLKKSEIDPIIAMADKQPKLSLQAITVVASAFTVKPLSTPLCDAALAIRVITKILEKQPELALQGITVFAQLLANDGINPYSCKRAEKEIIKIVKEQPDLAQQAIIILKTALEANSTLPLIEVIQEITEEYPHLISQDENALLRKMAELIAERVRLSEEKPETAMGTAPVETPSPGHYWTTVMGHNPAYEPAQTRMAEINKELPLLTKKLEFGRQDLLSLIAEKHQLSLTPRIHRSAQARIVEIDKRLALLVEQLEAEKQQLQQVPSEIIGSHEEEFYFGYEYDHTPPEMRTVDDHSDNPEYAPAQARITEIDKILALLVGDKKIESIHLNTNQLSPFRTMLSKLARPDNKAELDLDALLATLPENSHAMRKAVNELLAAMAAQPDRTQIDINKICQDNALDQDEQVALAVLASPGQGMFSRIGDAITEMRLKSYLTTLKSDVDIGDPWGVWQYHNAILGSIELINKRPGLSQEIIDALLARVASKRRDQRMYAIAALRDIFINVNVYVGPVQRAIDTLAVNQADLLSKKEWQSMREKFSLLAEREGLSKIPSEVYEGPGDDGYHSLSATYNPNPPPKYGPNPDYAPAQARIKEIDQRLAELAQKFRLEADSGIHLYATQLSPFRTMISEMAKDKKKECSIEDLLSTLPQNAVAMRQAVEQLFDAAVSTPEGTFTLTQADLERIIAANKLNQDEQVALVVLAHPGQGKVGDILSGISKAIAKARFKSYPEKLKNRKSASENIPNIIKIVKSRPEFGQQAINALAQIPEGCPYLGSPYLWKKAIDAIASIAINQPGLSTHAMHALEDLYERARHAESKEREQWRDSGYAPEYRLIAILTNTAIDTIKAHRIHLNADQLSPFRAMLAKLARPNNTAELDIDALLATLPENAVAMRNAVEKLLETMSGTAAEKVDIKKIVDTNKLNQDEETALAVFLHPGQGSGKKESDTEPAVSSQLPSPTGGIDVRDIKVGVSANSIPVEMPGVGPEFFQHYSLRIVRMEKI
jgi:hypothetical protein